MLQNIEIFRMAHAMASHAGARQGLIAQNLANADTPGYSPRDLRPFSISYRSSQPGQGPRATRPGHLHGTRAADTAAPQVIEAPSRDPNDNGVSIAEQTLRAVETDRAHGRALAIYRSSLTILRSALQTR